MLIFNTLAPIFVLIGVGALAFHYGFLDQATLHGINRLTYWVALPALLFEGAATADYSGAGVGWTVFVLIAASAVSTVIALGVGLRGLNLRGVVAGTFVHVAMRANLSFIGLPVLLYIIEARSGAEAMTLRTLVLLSMAPYLLVQNIAGILALLIGEHQSGASMFRTIAKNIITHPVLISLMAGVAVGSSGVVLPVFLERSFHSVGAVAAPAALISIGGALSRRCLRENLVPAVVATVIKIAMMPAIGYLLGTILGLNRDQLLVILVFLTCPTGASSFSFVAEMGGDQSLASATIVLSTLLAVIPLTLVLLMTV